MRVKFHALLVAVALIGGAAQASAATLAFDAVTFPGTGAPLSVTGSDGTVFTFTAGSSSQFQATQSGGIGSFPAGAFFLSPGLGNTTPINVSFSSPLTSISIPVSSDRVGDSPFTSTVQFFNGASLISTLTQSGNTQNPPLLFTSAGLFTSILISTLVDNAPFGFTQNIGAITYSVSAVPLPASLPLFVSGLAGLALLARRRKQKRIAA